MIAIAKGIGLNQLIISSVMDPFNNSNNTTIR